MATRLQQASDKPAGLELGLEAARCSDGWQSCSCCSTAMLRLEGGAWGVGGALLGWIPLLGLSARRGVEDGGAVVKVPTEQIHTHRASLPPALRAALLASPLLASPLTCSLSCHRVSQCRECRCREASGWWCGAGRSERVHPSVVTRSAHAPLSTRPAQHTPLSTRRSAHAPLSTRRSAHAAQRG